MKKLILLIMMLTVVSTSFGQKKNSKTTKTTQKYLTYDEYTNICDKLNSENYALKDSIYYRGKKSTCVKHKYFVHNFNNFNKNMAADTQRQNINEFPNQKSYSEVLEFIKSDTTDYSYKFPKNPIQNFIENNTSPDRYSYKIIKDYINNLSQKDNDSINKCISDFEKYEIKINKQISLNESKIEKYLYLRDNFSGTWSWITLYNGRKVWARYSNGTYYY